MVMLINVILVWGKALLQVIYYYKSTAQNKILLFLEMKVGFLAWLVPILLFHILMLL